MSNRIGFRLIEQTLEAGCREWVREGSATVAEIRRLYGLARIVGRRRKETPDETLRRVIRQARSTRLTFPAPTVRR